MRPLAHARASALLGSRYRLSLLVGGLLAGVCLLTRLGLFAVDPALVHDGPMRVLAALGAGEGLDLLAAAWLIAPLTLYLTVVPERWYRLRRHRGLMTLALGLVVYGILFVAVVELFFFADFDSRFNFVAVDYLMYPTEVVTNVWESYPTGLVLALLGAAAAAILLFARRTLSRAWEEPLPWRRRGAVALIYALALATLTWAVPPGLAQVSEDRALNEVAGNGYY